MSKKANSLLFSLLGLSALLFATLYFLLVWHNAYAADDLFFVWNVKTRGVIGSVVYMYNTWTPRSAEMLLYALLTKYFPERMALLIYGLIVFVLLINIGYLFIKHLISTHIFIQKIPNYVIFLFVTLFLASFFFFTFSIPETWFWLCSSAGYLLGLTASLYVIYFIASPAKSFITFSGLIVSSLYVAGSTESYFIFFFVVLILLLLWNASQFHFKFSQIKKSLQVKKIIVVLVLLSAGMLYLITSKGLSFRSNLLTHASFMGTLIITCKSIVKMFIWYVPTKIGYLLLFSIPFLVLGVWLKQEYNVQFNWTRKQFVYGVILFLFLQVIAIIPASYLLSDIGPLRSFTINAFLFTLFFNAFMMYVGNVHAHNVQLLPLYISGVVVIVSLLTYTLINQVEVTGRYKQSIASRYKLLKYEEQQKRQKTLYLDALPSSGLLHSAEITTDSLDYRNQFLKKHLGLSFNIALKP